jgi:hypothetical protein
MITGLQLPYRFDPARLRADLALIHADEWKPHFNQADYGGDWRGVALRSIGGASGSLSAPPSADCAAFSATEIFQRCAYFREVLAAFPCPLKAVRLLSLAPGSFVREHRDMALGYEDGEMRIHVPVQTSEEVEFYLAGERLHLEEGNSYYVNVSLPHRIQNRSQVERVHLVIDIAVDEWAHELVKRGQPIGRLPHRPRGFDDFRWRVLGDPALCEKLSAIPRMEAFRETVVHLGQELGFDFSEDEIEGCVGMGSGPQVAPPAGPARILPGWAPVAAAVPPTAEWIYYGTRRFREPFFEDSVLVCMQNPFTRAFRFSAPLESAPAGLSPSGFIFHMSRCGSTLITQMLGSLARVAVISEAPAIDDVIQAGRVDWLRSVVLALGQPHQGNEDRYFVKLDCWNIHKLSLIRAAFPDTPWIFLFRDPLEVMASHLRMPGRQMAGLIDPERLGMRPGEVAVHRREEWCARVLANILRSALEHRHDPTGLFLDYRQLPEAVWGVVAAHFHMQFDGEELATLRQKAQFNAKEPHMFFEADSERKRRDVSPLAQEIAAQLLDPLYRRLQEEART